MTVDLLKSVDFLKQELREFYAVIRRGGDPTTAALQLHTAVSCVEGDADEPAQQADMALEQRWGYVQLVSLIGTAKQELRQLTVLPPD